VLVLVAILTAILLLEFLIRLGRPLCLPLFLHEIENLARGDERGDRGRGEEDDDEQRAVPARTLAQSALCAHNHGKRQSSTICVGVCRTRPRRARPCRAARPRRGE
jgi:hypothetical protein